MRRPLRLLLFLLALGSGACAPDGPSAFVTFNLKPDSSCVFSPDATISFGIGLFDIAESGDGNGDFCKHRTWCICWSTVTCARTRT